MELPTITIVTPSYNQGEFLEATILSVLSQRYARLQYGLVDGGSTDGTREILERYRRHLDFVIVERDGGQSEAINKGLRMARGEVVGWLCSDDMLEPGALQAIGEHFAQEPGEVWLAGRCRTIDRCGRAMEVVAPKAARCLADALLRGEDRPFELPQPSVFWRRRLHDELGLLDEGLHYCMDFEWWCRLLAAGHRTGMTPRTLGLYRLHAGSKTCSKSLGFLREHLAVERRYGRALGMRDRLEFYRRLGYRRRQYEAARGRAALWRQVLVHPWWLASQQVRAGLVVRAA